MLSNNSLSINTLDGTIVSIEPRGLYSQRNTIPADGTTEIVFGYTVDTDTPPSEITFTINETSHTVAVEEHQDYPGFHGAEDTLTASQPMTITIEAEGESIEIEAI